MLWTGQQPAVAARAGPFLLILSLATIPNLISAILRNYVSALGRAGIATAITALALVVNTLGNYAFVFGHLGAPRIEPGHCQRGDARCRLAVTERETGHGHMRQQVAMFD
jgi:hypothetical protein